MNTLPAHTSTSPATRARLDTRTASGVVVGLIAIVTVLPAVAGAPGIGILLAMLIIGIVVRLRRGGLRAIGFTSPASWPKTASLAIALGVVIQLASLALLDPLIESLTGTPIDLTQFESLRGNFPSLLIWLAIVWVLVVFVEEIIFRGFLMTELRHLLGDNRVRLFANLLLTSALFGLAHWYQGISGVLSTGLIGLILGLIFIRTGFNIWLPILVHGFIDTVGLAMIFANADLYFRRLW